MKYYCLLLLALVAGMGRSSAQGAAFSYQGQLNNNGSPANGLYDFRFKLYYDANGNTQAGSAFTTNGVSVAGGLFITAVDFGANLFAGSNYWLEVDVMTNGAADYSVLAPLQALMPVPYAVFAQGASSVLGSVAATQVSGTLPLAHLPAAVVTNNGSGLNLSGTFTGNGATLTALNASQLATGTVPDSRLAGDVVFTDSNQTFTAQNVFMTGTNSGGRLVVYGTNGIDSSSFNGLGFQFYSGTGEGAIISSHNNAPGFLSFYTKQGNGYPPVLRLLLDTNGGLRLDPQNANAGAINDGSPAGAGITFGPDSGEGIASQRQPSGGNQFGLDFYTGYTKRMSISQSGAITVNGRLVLPTLPVICNGAATNVFVYADANTNTAMGLNALAVSTNAGENTAIGFDALAADTSGYHNTAVGGFALSENTTGCYNDAGGYHALANNSAGFDNTAFGDGALFDNYTGSDNTGVGYVALDYDYYGAANTAVGSGALMYLGADDPFGGTNNIAIGYYAGGNFNSGESGNIDIGNYGIEGENNITRIGTPGVQTQTYLAGLVQTDGGLVVDNTGANSGNLNSNAISFGGAPGLSGEGLASKRTSGGTQYDLEFYTDFNERIVVAHNGDVGVGNSSPTHLFQVGNAYCDGNTWSPSSDRNLKAGFTPVDSSAVLAQVSRLPISRWHYTNNVAAPHMGPMAQDFYAAFGTGADDRHIADVDEAGVALAAIQGLNQKVESENQALRAENSELKARLERIEQALRQKN